MLEVRGPFQLVLLASPSPNQHGLVTDVGPALETSLERAQ